MLMLSEVRAKSVKCWLTSCTGKKNYRDSRGRIKKGVRDPFVPDDGP